MEGVEQFKECLTLSLFRDIKRHGVLIGYFTKINRRQSRNMSQITSDLGTRSTSHRHEVNENMIWDK